MADATRRGFLAAAGTGTAIAVVATASRASAAPRSDGAVLVAYIEDPRSGVLSLMVGEDEVEIHDADLVRRLVKAAGGKA